MMVKIYCLINPVTGHPFYVGATSGYLSDRLSGHISARHQTWVCKHNQIMEDMFELGIKPEIVLLDEVGVSEASFHEDFYMRLLSFYGFSVNKRKSGYTEYYNSRQETLRLKSLKRRRLIIYDSEARDTTPRRLVANRNKATGGDNKPPFLKPTTNKKK